MVSVPDPAASLTRLLGDYTAERRLYAVEGDGDLGGLLVESWSLRERLDEPWELRLNALSPRPDLDIHAFLGQPLTLLTTLADGSRHPRGGLVTDATAGDADGGLTRYALTVQPWLALLGYTRRSQLWQDRSLVQIVESVFSAYAPHAAWRWAPDTAAHLAASPHSDPQGLRGTTTQYRETDLAFVQRLLAEEGLVYRFEPDEAASAGQCLVLLADTPSAGSCPPDPTSAAGGPGTTGIRFHRASSIETQDAVQAFGARRSLPSATRTVLAWDDQAKKAVATRVPTAAAFGGKHAPRLASYDPTSPGTYPSAAQAERAGVLQQQALEARHKAWLGRGTVRTFTAGRTFELTQSPLERPTDAPRRAGDPATTFLLLSVVHAGINNLPKGIRAVAGQPGHPPHAPSSADILADGVDPELRRQAQATGYANAFEATRAHVPWRPVAVDETGARLNPRPTALGMQTATVVGAQGQTVAHGADEIHTDALGRIRVQFHFQSASRPAGMGPGTSASSTWVRVLQRYAGAGMGLQFIPRIGQEVLVDFIEGDIDRPLVVGALYNGKGEGGTPATPGGRPHDADLRAFAHSTDHAPGAQGNLIGAASGGHSPAWHGAASGDLAAGGQRNAGALSGVKTQEFGGAGFNQLVFDDTDRQLRTQLATTQHATQLNLGHLVHQADNHRGSFRGLGFELRTDAYGAVRAGRGLLLSSYGTTPDQPAGENAAGVALAQQMVQLAQTFNTAARTHQTVQLAGHIGSSKANQSRLSSEASPLKALHAVLEGRVSAESHEQAQADAGQKTTGSSDDRVPHTTDPVIAISAQAGLAVVAGQDIQLAAGEGLTLAAGRDSHWAVGGATRIHTGQAIGMLAGAVRPGDQAVGSGLTMIAAHDDVDLQAQADRLQVAAKGDVAIQSQVAHIDWAAAKRIVLQTAGGASITIEGGNVTVACPGTLTVRAGVKSFTGPERVDYALPGLPNSICVACLLAARASGSAFAVK